jgi:hypothetical protein
MIDRRDLIARLGGTIFVWPPQVRGQEPGRTYRVGWLSGLPHDAPTHVALYDAEPARFCRESNRQIDGQGFGLPPDQFAQHAAELVNAKVDVIYCGAPAVRASSRQRSASDLRPCTRRHMGQKPASSSRSVGTIGFVGMGKTPKIPDGGDDPDKVLYRDYVCGADGNIDGYCNPEVDALIDRQSIEADPQKRKQLVWEIERKLAEDGARPIIFYSRFASCWQPYVKGLTLMVNSIFNGYRMEDVWLDR